MQCFAIICFRFLALVMVCSVLTWGIVDPSYSGLIGWCQMIFGSCGVAEVFVYRRSIHTIRQNLQEDADEAAATAAAQALAFRYVAHPEARARRP